MMKKGEAASSSVSVSPFLGPDRSGEGAVLIGCIESFQLVCHILRLDAATMYPYAFGIEHESRTDRYPGRCCDTVDFEHVYSSPNLSFMSCSSDRRASSASSPDAMSTRSLPFSAPSVIMSMMLLPSASLLSFRTRISARNLLAVLMGKKPEFPVNPEVFHQ